MVAYNFQPEFVSMIRAGVKVSTIRPIGKRIHAKAGDELQLYTGQRTDSCELILRTVCAASWPLTIEADRIVRAGQVMTNPAYFETLAAMEGFETFGNLQAWFDRRYGLPFVGHQVRWFAPGKIPAVAAEIGVIGI